MCVTASPTAVEPKSIVVPSGVTSIDARHGIWQSLGPGDVITFTVPYTVVQADIDNLQ